MALLSGCWDDEKKEEPRAVPKPPDASSYALPPPPAPGALDIDTAAVDFGAVDFAQVRTLRLRNTGGLPVALGGTIAPAPFASSYDCPASLEAGSACTVTVSVEPSFAGRANAILTIKGQGTNTINVSLTATHEVQAPPPPPQVKALSDAEILAAARAQYAADLEKQRQEQGPAFFDPDPEPSPKKPEKWRNTDIDYQSLTVAPPIEESSFPVDREFLLTPTRKVSGVLLTPIDTSLPGDVEVMVTEDVYGANGKHKILESGDVFIARYESMKKQGDTRVNLNFYRIERTADGATLYDSEKPFAYATDAMGRTGLAGEVFNRTWERYESAILTAAISTAPVLAMGAVAPDNQNMQQGMQVFAQQTGQATAKTLEKMIDLAPIVQIDGGAHVAIRLTQDIHLKRPERVKEEKETSDAQKKK